MQLRVDEVGQRGRDGPDEEGRHGVGVSERLGSGVGCVRGEERRGGGVGVAWCGVDVSWSWS